MRNPRRLAPAFALLLALTGLAGCALSGTAAPSSPGPNPSPGPRLTQSELKLALENRFGQLWYCDPDEFPIARGDESDRAIERFAEVRADHEAFTAIVAGLSIQVGGDFSAAQKLAIYREWKRLNAIVLDPIGNDRFRFDYRAMPKAGAAEGTRTAGVIDVSGVITIEQQAAATEPPCPICLARGSLVDTPRGPVAVDALKVGSEVWTLDADGRRIAATVLEVGSVAVPASHRVVHLVLADGRELRASPRHPLADGRALGALSVGDQLDGSTITRADLEAYDGGATFDLLPSGPTGTYLVGGIPLDSTLRR